MTKKLTRSIIKEYLKGKTLTEVGSKFGIHFSYISQILQRNNIKTRSLSESHITKKCDQSFWERIDCEAKAYFLGFLYADGAITHNSFKLTLQNKDRYMVLKFKKVLQSNHKAIEDRDNLRFGISNQKMYKDLLNLGCSERKSLTLRFPTEAQVPLKYLHHFIRGYFDGDGCVKYSIDKKYGYIFWHMEFISTFHFNQGVQKEMGKYIPYLLNLKLVTEQRQKKLCYFTAGGTRPESIQKIYDYLYKDATLFLYRKKNKFEKILRLSSKDLKARQKKTKGFHDLQKRILTENRHKALNEVAKIIGYKNGFDVSDLYKQYNIKRTYIRP